MQDEKNRGDKSRLLTLHYSTYTTAHVYSTVQYSAAQVVNENGVGHDEVGGQDQISWCIINI